MKQIADCTDQELGYVAYMNIKRIETLRNENAVIDQALAERQAKQANKAETEAIETQSKKTK